MKPSKILAEAELRFFKSQLNPHFLFNTMNNLYALTLKKSDKAPEFDFALKYFIGIHFRKTAKKTFINLSDEISTLEDYIYVESFRCWR